MLLVTRLIAMQQIVRLFKTPSQQTWITIISICWPLFAELFAQMSEVTLVWKDTSEKLWKIDVGNS